MEAECLAIILFCLGAVDHRRFWLRPVATIGGVAWESHLEIGFYRNDQRLELLAQLFPEERPMSESLKPGDRVEWESSHGTVTGKVKKKLVKPAKIKGHQVAASPDNPEYLVESEKTRAQAAHKPEALTKMPQKKKGRS